MNKYEQDQTINESLSFYDECVNNLTDIINDRCEAELGQVHANSKGGKVTKTVSTRLIAKDVYKYLSSKIANAMGKEIINLLHENDCLREDIKNISIKYGASYENLEKDVICARCGKILAPDEDFVWFKQSDPFHGFESSPWCMACYEEIKKDLFGE